MKLGFFGGSFNPLTYAHLNIAKSVINIFLEWENGIKIWRKKN